MPEIYISGRQFGKTTMLIKESARTGATIAVANYKMVEYVQSRAREMGLDIPEPVTYAEMFKSYWHNKTTRYLVDELQMMLSQLNVDICTLNYEPVRYLNHWSYPDGYQPRLTFCRKSDFYIDERAAAKLYVDSLKRECQKFQQEKFKDEQMDKLVQAVCKDSKGENDGSAELQ